MTFDKKNIYNYLDGHGINYETTEHKAVSNMEELADIQLPYPENIAKTSSYATTRNKITI